MNYKEFITLFNPVIKYFSATVSDEIIKLYFHSLEHLSVDEFGKAIKKILNTKKTNSLPKIAEFLEALSLSDEEMQDKIIQAKNDLRYALKRGTGYSVKFKDKALMCVVAYDLGGWHELGRKSVDEIENFLKWDFEKIYKYYLKNQQKAPKYLKGRDEIDNNFNNQTNQFIKLLVIGDCIEQNLSLLSFLEQENKTKLPHFINQTLLKIGASA